jgi:pimeloyl-ACP methyl ester carboxylesterase
MAMSTPERGPGLAKAEASVFASFALAPRVRHLHPPGAPRLRALETGDGEPVLLLHGITHLAAHWAPLLPALGSFRCVALDLPGHGGSEPVDHGGRDLRQWYDSLLLACLDELGLESAHFVGHSLGGVLALWLALDAPERVRSVVVGGAPALAFPGARPDPTLRLLATGGLGRVMLALPIPLAAYRRILAASLGGPAVEQAPAALIRATHAASRRQGFARTVTSFLAEELHGPPSRRRRYTLTPEECERLEAPVLVLWGDRDRFQRVPDAERVAGTLPRGRLEVLAAGHEPWLEDAPRGRELVATFLQDAREPGL